MEAILYHLLYMLNRKDKNNSKYVLNCPSKMYQSKAANVTQLVERLLTRQELCGFESSYRPFLFTFDCIERRKRGCEWPVKKIYLLSVTNLAPLAARNSVTVTIITSRLAVDACRVTGDVLRTY